MIKWEPMNARKIITNIVREIDSALGKIEKVDVVIKAILSADKIFVAGSGRSGLIINTFAQRLSHLGLKAHVAGSIIQPSASKRDLLIVASGSGESVFPAGIVQKAKEIGMEVVLITAEQNSPIAENSDLIIHIPVFSKKTTDFQPLGSLFEQCLLIFCDALALIIQNAKKISPETLYKNHANLE